MQSPYGNSHDFTVFHENSAAAMLAYCVGDEARAFLHVISRCNIEVHMRRPILLTSMQSFFPSISRSVALISTLVELAIELA
jgi:hypothetical protein